MQLKLNREFAVRYAFVALLMFGMGGWFGYDGYVKYPSMTAAGLYESCHGGEAAASPEAAEKFRATAIPRQKQFMTLCFIAGVLVALCLLRAVRFRFSYDENGFDFGGKRYAFADVASVDLKRWEKKGILVVRTADAAITLDSWHHTGVDAFRELLLKNGKSGATGA